MNLFAVAELLMILPLISQLLIGSMAMRKRIGLNFGLVCLINLILQIIFIIISLKLVSIDVGKQRVHCGMPLAAMFFLGIMMVLALILLMIIQLTIRWFVNRKQKNNILKP